MTTPDGGHSHSRWYENRAGQSKLRLDVRDMVAHREVAWFLALRDIQLRYKQTLLGAIWALLPPLVGALLFTLVFGRAVGVPSDGLPYAVFVFSGLMGWTLFANGINFAAVSLVDHEALVTKVYFPRLLAPIAAVLPCLLDFAIALPVLAVIMAVGGVTPGWAIVTLPLWLLLLVVVTVGVGAALAALAVRYRDVRHALPFLVQIWLFATPVVYPSSLPEGAVRWILYANPVVAPIDGLRWALVDGPAPGAGHVLSLSVALVLTVAGVAYFARNDRELADVI